MKNRKEGFTMVEVLVTITILAVAAAIAIPNFSKAKFSSRKNEAITYLRGIRTAEKMYWAKWKTYVACSDAAAIRGTLGLEIQLAGYTYAVTAPTSTTFEAKATRNSDDQTLILNQDGTWSGNNTPLPTS